MEEREGSFAEEDGVAEKVVEKDDWREIWGGEERKRGMQIAEKECFFLVNKVV